MVLKDLKKKIVLLVGPRQAGKTWLAKDIAKEFYNSVYLNYDSLQDRVIINAQSWLPTTNLLIFDELHKMPSWKNYLKGVFDTKHHDTAILVTGSARLDIYDHLGDSLAGRYFRHRLLPFSPAELCQLDASISFEKLLVRSGFPEPLFAPDDTEAERWRMQYVNSMLSTDVFEVDQIHNIKAMQLVFKLLRNRVGSPISYQSIAEDVAVSPITVKRYIEILEALFIVFRVTPFSKNIARSLLKEPKIYFFDTGLVQGDDGAKLENMVAISLLKHVYAKNDYHAQAYALHYLRTKDGVEVDFALTCDDVLEEMIEVKLADAVISRSLASFSEKHPCSAVQLVKHLRHETMQGNILVRDAQKYLSELFL